jgi:hypothetical protein
MSTEITVAFVQQYSDNIIMLSQQQGSRLEGAVRVEPGVVGENQYFERIGATTAQERTTRHGDSPMVNTPHSRRRVSLKPYDWGDMVDEPDQVRMLIRPESKYVQNATWALGRAKDDVIIKAFYSDAYAGKDGSTPAAFLSGNKVAQDGTPSSLTVAKLRKAKVVLDKGEVDPADPRFIVAHSMAIDNLLSDTTVTSSDFNVIKALVQGDIDTFVGFKFIRVERLPLVTTGTYRAAYAWAKSGIGLAIGTEIKTEVTKRADKNFSVYVWASMDLGATRVEDEKVVEIPCLAGD